MQTLRIATRKSPLALWQAEHVMARLLGAHADLHCELVPITTTGDRFLNATLTEVGGKSMFVKELELALLDGTADIAVHSMKDVTAQLPDGLHIPVYTTREDPRDVLVGPDVESLAGLPENARIGTASSRRQCQLLAARPDLRIMLARGNVNTRLAKLDAGEFDALVLAASGLIRLELGARIACTLEPEQMLPAVGQGIMGIECRAGDTTVEARIAVVNDEQSHLRITAERAMNAALGGGCTAPMAGYAVRDGTRLWLRGLVGSLDGQTRMRADGWRDVGEIAAAPDGAAALLEAEALGESVAQALLDQGAGALLKP